MAQKMAVRALAQDLGIKLAVSDDLDLPRRSSPRMHELAASAGRHRAIAAVAIR